MKSGIYKITNTTNGKMYVGKSKNIKHRWTVHKSSLRGNTHKNEHLQHAWNKYGESMFLFEVLEYCNDEILSINEYKWVNYYDAGNEKNGYNIQEIDEYGVYNHSDSTKRKISEKAKNRKYDDERKLRISIAAKIVHSTMPIEKKVEVYRKIAESNRGKIRSDQSKENIRNGRDYSDTTMFNKFKKPVIQLTIDGVFIEEFESIKAAARYINKKSSSILRVCNNENRYTAHGYQWIYKRNYQNKIKNDTLKEIEVSN